jgi:hypothetical protein
MPVTWIVVAHDHHDMNEGHVTLLSEELIGLFAFDDSTDRDHEYAEWGYNHWGKSGTGNARHGLRPWLNSSGLHAGEGFYRAFSEEFKRAVLATTLPNKEWERSNSYNTHDYVFIPSSTELGDEEHGWTYRIGDTELGDEEHGWTYRIGDVYAYFFGVGDRERVALMVGDGWHEIVEKIWGKEKLNEWGVHGNNWYHWTRSPGSLYGAYVRYVRDTGEFTNGFGANIEGTAVRPALNLKSGILVSEITH